MKPLLLFAFFFLMQKAFAQSLDYISVRKKNNRVIKNFYRGSNIVLQTTDYAYLEGPVKAIRNDSVFITLYDIRMIPTNYGGFVRDTMTTTVASVYYKDIKRIYLQKRSAFYKRSGPSLLMAGGAGYFALNVLNGAFYNQGVPGSERIKRLGISAGIFGLGYLFQKIFRSDGFSKPSQQIAYINLSPRKA